MAMMQVFVLPPKESLKSLVSLLSLKIESAQLNKHTENRKEDSELPNIVTKRHYISVCTCKVCEWNVPLVHL